MSNIPAQLKYTNSHEWLEVLADGNVRVGITDHAQELLGDMVYVELPEVGRSLSAKEECAVVESVKAASDVYSPISGEVVEVNDALADAPELINSAAYSDGWMMVIKPADAAEIGALLSADAYADVAASDDH